MKPKVSIDELSRYLDGQVTEEERAELEERISSCPLSKALKVAFEQAMESIGSAILTARPCTEEEQTEDCLDDSIIMRIADKNITPAEEDKIEAHILRCRCCLSRVVANLRTARRMESGNWPKLPDSVMNNSNIRQLVVTEDEPVAEDWEEVVYNVGSKERGFVFEKQNVSVSITLKPFAAGMTSMSVSVYEKLRSKLGQEVVLVNSATHRKTFTGTTNAVGVINVNKLPAGEYQLHLVDSDTRIAVKIID